jgi:MFS family permease
MLITGRVIQGVGGGSIGVMTQLIISDLVSVRERGKYMGIILAVFGLGTTLGPVIGGVIVSRSSWRWVFWLNLPIGGFTLVLQFFFLQVHYTKRSTFKEKMKKIDWIGNSTLIASLVSILIALSWADTRYAWSSLQIILPLALGAAGTVLFHVYEATKICEQPTIPPRAFGSRTSATALVLTFVQSMLTYWRVYFLPVYFQAVLLHSPESAGILLLPTVAVGIPVAIVAGFILTKTGRYKPLHIFGFAVITLAAGLYILFDASSSLGEVLVFQILAGLGTGCLLTTLLPAVQAGLTQADVAIATSTWGFIRSYGSIWGVAVPAAVLNSAFARSLNKITDPVLRAQLSRGSVYSHASSDFIRSLPDVSRRQVIQAYSSSLKVIWQVACGISAVSFLLVFLEKEIKLRTTVKSDYGMKQKSSAKKSKETGV